MSIRDGTFLLAALGHLALALLSVSRAGTSPLALPLSLLAFDFFGWTFAAFCDHTVAHPLWRCLDVVFTSLAPAVVLHFILAFVGRLRVRRHLLLATYGFFGLLAAPCLTSWLTPWGREWIESPAYTLLFVAGWIPSLGYEVAILINHLRTGCDAEERARTRIVLAALALGGVLASTDLIDDLGVPMPGLAPLGTLISTLLLALVALKFRLFDRNLERMTTLYAACVAAASILVYLTLFQGLQSRLPALTFGVTVVTLVLTAVVRETTSSMATYRERVERLAVLGRFSAQMAHDLKNPLAALVGAVQVLEGDGSCDSEFRTMIVEQANRIRAIVEKYDRIGRVEPIRSIIQPNDVIKRICALSQHGAPHALSWTLTLDREIPECNLDHDLFSGAIENLVRNAIEATTAGATIRVRTRRESTGLSHDTAVVSIEDTGVGMDARQAERAFDDFYTTKPTGSGLGLAFVRRVALAHGGDVSITSKLGVGTKVEIRFPIQ